VRRYKNIAEISFALGQETDSRSAAASEQDLNDICPSIIIPFGR